MIMGIALASQSSGISSSNLCTFAAGIRWGTKEEASESQVGTKERVLL